MVGAEWVKEAVDLEGIVGAWGDCKRPGGFRVLIMDRTVGHLQGMFYM